MPNTTSFHDVRFPVNLALGSTGGPVRRTEIISLGSGREQRNTRWVNSRRRYNAGYGIKTLTDLQTVIEFFEERRGRLFGFRFRDPLDWKSSGADAPIGASDQEIGTGDGTTAGFQLIKTYGEGTAGYKKKIVKPVEDTVQVAINQVPISSENFTVSTQTGVVMFDSGAVPEQDQIITAGFEFDIPVRFDADEITVNLSHFEAGNIPSIPLVELLP